jgi:hypothetical protein
MVIVVVRELQTTTMVRVSGGCACKLLAFDVEVRGKLCGYEPERPHGGVNWDVGGFGVGGRCGWPP